MNQTTESFETIPYTIAAIPNGEHPLTVQIIDQTNDHLTETETWVFQIADHTGQHVKLFVNLHPDGSERMDFMGAPSGLAGVFNGLHLLGVIGNECFKLIEEALGIG